MTDIHQRIVVVESGNGHGAGVIWNDRWILTNHHVASGARARVRRRGGEAREASVLARDTERDLALLSFPSFGLGPIEVGPAPAVGQLVLAVGHPLGLAYHTTMGIVSGQGGDMLCADLALAPGNSGGPIFDADGRLVGLSTMVRPPRQAFAVPAADIVRFVGSVSPPGRRAA